MWLWLELSAREAWVAVLHLETNRTLTEALQTHHSEHFYAMIRPSTRSHYHHMESEDDTG